MAYEAEARVVLSHQRAVEIVRQRLKTYAVSRWNTMQSWRDADVERFIAEIVPVVQTGQKTVGQLTNAYLDAMATLAGMPQALPAAPVLDARGVPPEEVYRRPAVTLYTALSEGKTLTEAVTLGSLRLADLVLTDLQLTHVHTANAKMRSASGIVGYRRTLTGLENCALCALASSQRYHKSDLLPIHPGCDCGVAPIYGDSDPGQVINQDAYDKAMTALNEKGVSSHGGTEGRYRDATDILIREHGEFGPTLTWRGQKFTGPSDI